MQPHGNSVRIDRRLFLAAAAATPLVASAVGRALGGPPTVKPMRAAGPAAGLITRQGQPSNLEFPFHALDSFVTPNKTFFVRNHFAIPALDAASWRLECSGHVEQPQQLTYDQLRALPAKTVTATLECAGNGRALLVPKAKGVPWELGAVGNAEWTGVPLAVVLERAGLKPGAVDVLLEGADKGEITDDPRSPGEIHFARSLPMEKARRGEVLLAYKMNGQDLPREHGFPVRAIVPGWYGMASIKWLARIIVLPTSFAGYWQTSAYTYWNRVAGEPTQVPVGEMQLKSQIARPAAGETVPAGKPYRVVGAAWAGETEVARVEVSTDDGRSWQPARLLGATVPFAWRLWEYAWAVPQAPGAYKLLCRATDTHGQTQPTRHDPDRRGYLITHSVPVEVTVK